jgi:hypothetical protein
MKQLRLQEKMFEAAVRKRPWQLGRQALIGTYEKPRSSVIPRSRLSFDLSKAAVESIVESVLTKEVLPESTWPRTPTFTFSIFP